MEYGPYEGERLITLHIDIDQMEDVLTELLEPMRSADVSADIPPGGSGISLTEYQKNTSVCRACDHLIQRDWRMTHKPAGGTNPATQEARDKRLATLLARYNDLAKQIDALQAAKRADAEKAEQQQEQNA